MAKVYPEILTLILELQESKASQEIQASRVAAAMMAPPATTVFQEDLVSLDQREVLVKQDGLG